MLCCNNLVHYCHLFLVPPSTSLMFDLVSSSSSSLFPCYSPPYSFLFLPLSLLTHFLSSFPHPFSLTPFFSLLNFHSFHSLLILSLLELYIHLGRDQEKRKWIWGLLSEKRAPDGNFRERLWSSFPHSRGEHSYSFGWSDLDNSNSSFVNATLSKCCILLDIYIYIYIYIYKTRGSSFHVSKVDFVCC